VSVAGPAAIDMLGDSRRLSLTVAGSSIKTTFGAELGVVVEVTHKGATPDALVAVHPTGKAGAVTPSKFSERAVAGDDDGLANKLIVPPGQAEVELALAVALVTAWLTVITEVAVLVHTPLFAVTV